MSLNNTNQTKPNQSVSCITILFLNLQITRSDIRPHIKWAVSLVIAYGHFNLPHGFMWVYILTLSAPRADLPLTILLFSIFVPVTIFRFHVANEILYWRFLKNTSNPLNYHDHDLSDNIII